jgi:hypothetical protein
MPVRPIYFNREITKPAADAEKADADTDTGVVAQDAGIGWWRRQGCRGQADQGCGQLGG